MVEDILKFNEFFQDRVKEISPKNGRRRLWKIRGEKMEDNPGGPTSN